MQHTFKRGIFDRYDGWRVRNVDTFFSVAPFILRTRIDSQCFFEETIPIENLEAFIRKQEGGHAEITFMHVHHRGDGPHVLAAPYLNRFIVWNKIYARNSIHLSLAHQALHDRPRGRKPS